MGTTLFFAQLVRAVTLQPVGGLRSRQSSLRFGPEPAQQLIYRPAVPLRRRTNRGFRENLVQP